MLNLLFALASLALRVVSWAMLIYCVMSFVMPQSDWFRKAAGYVEPLLHPVRMQLYRWFPALGRMPVDFSPLAVWLLIDVADWVLRLLRGIF